MARSRPRRDRRLVHGPTPSRAELADHDIGPRVGTRYVALKVAEGPADHAALPTPAWLEEGWSQQAGRSGSIEPSRIGAAKDGVMVGNGRSRQTLPAPGGIAAESSRARRRGQAGRAALLLSTL